jgi:hypothetical protein
MKSQPQLYVRQELTDPWQLLDTFDVEPLKMTLRVQDVMDPTVAVSSFSQTLRVPNTTRNGRFFQAVFNVNQTFFDPSKKAYAYIQDEGMFYMDGNIQLMSCYFNEQSQNIEYEITFFGETSDFASQIGIDQEQGFLKNLDLTAYDHEVTYDNIRNSWTGAFKDGAVVYPLCEWGYTYANTAAGAPLPIQSTLSIAGTKSFTSAGNPLSIRQFKPALKARVIWDAIFNTTQYTYNFTSSKFEALFDKLFIISDQEARSTYEAFTGFSGKSWGIEPQEGIPEPFYIDTIVYDYGSNFKSSDWPQKFVATAPGSYTFTFTADYNWYSGGYNANTRFLFTLLNPASTNTWDSTDWYFSDNNGTLNVTATANLLPGDAVVFATSMVGTYGNVYGNILLRNIRVLGTTSANQVPISNILPANIKQIDFIRSLVERFKLVFVPSKEITKHFEICPWDEWVQQGETRDWSEHFNGKVDFKTYPLFQTQNRFITFKDQEDNDFVNYNWQNAWKQVYGQYNLDSQIEVIKGTKTVQGIFAPLPIAPLGYSATATEDQILKANTFLIPHIAKDTVQNDRPGQRLPMQPKLRLAFYNGLCGATGVNTNTSVTWYLDNAGTPEPQNSYPLMSNSYPDPWTENAYILDWRQTLIPTWDPTISGNPPLSANNTFENYWRRWYDSAYGALDPRTGVRDYSSVLECEVILNYHDVWNLRFNDKIWIKDAYYLINSIETYFVGQLSPCKVQLYKMNNLGIALDHPFKLIADVCYSPSSLCNAACCLPGSTATNVYCSTLEEDLAVGDRFYTNEGGTTFAPNGYYAIGDYVYTITGDQGIISAKISKEDAACVCIPELFEVEVCFSDTNNYCEACCCVGETTSVWCYDNDPAVWFSQPIFYTDAIGTARVADGYYSDQTNFVQTLNGVNQQSGNCEACNCEIYRLTTYNGCYDTIECNAVCCTDSENTRWYGDAATLATCENLYSDQNGTPAPNGWYYDGISVVQVSAGIIVTVGDPADCQPCVNENLSVYFDFEGKVSGTGTFKIYKSFDAANWMIQSSKNLATIPALTPFGYTGPVAPGTYVRGVLQYGPNYTTGTFNTTIEQTSALLNTYNTVPGPTYTYTPTSFTDTGNEYRFSVGLTGSNLDCGITGASAWKCIDPTCIIDGSNSDYVVDYNLTTCCDPLYISTDGRLVVYDATLLEDANCTTPPTTCFSCGQYVSGNYSGTDYHAYENYYICDDLDTTEISLAWSVIDRPNRFTIYQDGSLVATTGWVGYANYAGPWGLSLNTPNTGILSTSYLTGLNTYVYVEAGPANPSAPTNDAFTFTISCSTSCYAYLNNSGQNWTGDWQDCNGDWHYAEVVPFGNSVCARVGTPFTIYGVDLTIATQCNY